MSQPPKGQGVWPYPGIWSQLLSKVLDPSKSQPQGTKPQDNHTQVHSDAMDNMNLQRESDKLNQMKNMQNTGPPKDDNPMYRAHDENRARDNVKNDLNKPIQDKEKLVAGMEAAKDKQPMQAKDDAAKKSFQ